MNAALLAPWAATGVVAGAAFFGSLRWLTRRLLVDPAARAPWARLALVQLLRLALLAALLFGAARSGAAALLACAAGTVAARIALLARLRREVPR